MIFSRSGPVLLLRPCGTSGSLSLSLWAAHPPALSFSGLPPCGPVPLRVTVSALVAQWPTLYFYVFVFVCIWLCIFLWACTTPTVWASSTQGHTLGTCCTWGQWPSFQGILCLSLCRCLCICLSVCLCLVCITDSQQESFTQGHNISTCCTTISILGDWNQVFVFECAQLAKCSSDCLMVSQRHVQYCIGGSGVSRGPQKRLRNLCTTPNRQW